MTTAEIAKVEELLGFELFEYQRAWLAGVYLTPEQGAFAIRA